MGLKEDGGGRRGGGVRDDGGGVREEGERLSVQEEGRGGERGSDLDLNPDPDLWKI